ncbi:MAG: HAD-IIA family hydrolase [Chitinispirillaceae bacterium]|nr:HAD-IIA family hydrolase [Chitinispirillaceae bacterium]
MMHIPATRQEQIQKTGLFVFDLDGTVYLGDAPIRGAPEFIRSLRTRGIPYVFITNNSSRSASYYRKKIAKLGIPVALENIYTSGQATGNYLSRKKKGAKVYVLGTRSLACELASYGLVITGGSGEVDYVVAGFDTELNYGKLRIACDLIDRGCGYIATNPDYVCPVARHKSIPDCGSICFMIEQATGKKPYVVGKPRPEMIKQLAAHHKVPLARVTAIGDRLYTDIAAGKNAGALTICVLSGEATRKSIARFTLQPDLVIDSIDDLNPLFAQ